MIPERLKKIIELLITKTKNKKTIWNKTSGNDQFKLSIPDGSAITISRWDDQYQNDEFFVVIFNSNGDAIERFGTDNNDISQEEIKLLQQFHKTASDSYYKVEETMDALLASLIGQDIIGNEETPPPPLAFGAPDEEDLPF